MDHNSSTQAQDMNRKLLFLISLAGLIGLALISNLSSESGNLDSDRSTHFSIKDTARVTRIRIADSEGRVALLERIPEHPLGLWQLNGTLLARKDATDLLLKTFKRISVRQPVRSSAKEGVLKMMASAGKRVDIHLDGVQEPAKTWFVGTPTQSHTGTHMLLELPGEGRSEDPYVTHIEGFTGFLSTRFFTDENEWRYTGVFASRADDIASITAIPLDDVGMAATLSWSGDGTSIEAQGPYGRIDIPQTLLREQWLKFRKVHVETWNSHLDAQGKDSLRKSAPAWNMKVQYKDGRNVELALHWKPPILEEFGDYGELLEHDGSRMYAIHNGECALVQTFVFNPLLDFWRGLSPDKPLPSSS